MKLPRVADNKKILFSLFGAIVLLGFFLRIYKLTSAPAGFFCDEAAIGYNAYSILKTGVDEYGKPYPFFFRSFGAYRNPVPIYLMTSSIAIFGLNEFAVRFTSAVIGILTVFFVFFLIKQVFDFKVAFFSSFFLAISPWHIHFSRFGSEYIYFPFFFTFGLLVFILGLKRKFYLPIAFFIFGASLYTYYPAWLIIPLFVFGLMIFYHHQLLKKKKEFLVGFLIFLFALVPLLVGVKNEVALTRWGQVSVLKTIQSQKLGFSDSFKTLANTYLSHFSYDFLFKKGDINYPGHFIRRFSVRGMGELYLFQLPLLIIGCLLLIINWKKPFSKVIFLWLALYPLGSTLIGTDGGGPFAFRSIFGVVPFQIISAIGITKIISFFKNRFKFFYIVFIFSFLFVSILSLKNYLYRYHVEYPLYSSDFWGWQYGPKEVMKYFLSAKNQYDELFLMGNFNSPEIFIKFYDPENSCHSRCQIGGLEKLDQNKKQLYAIGADRLNEIPGHLVLLVIKKIYYPNKSPAFLIGEIKPNNVGR